jgi:GNAT superfamily N-acetyltransferase
VTYELRTAVDTDKEFCFRLNEISFRSRIEAIRGWDESRERLDCAAQFNPVTDRILVLDGAAVGHFAVVERSDCLDIRMLLLRPQAQNCGIGSALVQAVLRRAESKGATRSGAGYGLEYRRYPIL